MFGVVPKSMWKKINPPDENNMCNWAMRCLLVEDGDRLILIDNGIGNKQDDKFFFFFFFNGDDTLSKSLTTLGFHEDDITDMFLTHLHFDHCGGVSNGIQQKINLNLPLRMQLTGAMRSIGNGQQNQIHGRKRVF